MSDLPPPPTPTPPPPPGFGVPVKAKRPWYRKKRYILGGGLLAIIIVAAVAGGEPEDTEDEFGKVASTTTEAPATTEEQAPETTTPTTTTTEATTTTTEATTTTIDPMQADMAEWAVKNMHYPEQMSEKFTAVTDAANNGDFAGVRDACREMQSLAREYLSHPAPDPAVNEPLARGLGRYVDAGEACATATVTFDAELMNQAVDMIDAANLDIEAATAAMDRWQS